MNNNCIINPWDIFDIARKSLELDRSVPSTISPRIRLNETEAGLEMFAELPGVAPEDIDVSIDGKKLSIVAKRVALGFRKPEPVKAAPAEGGEAKDAEPEAIPDEFIETFERSIMLPYEVNHDAVKAECRNGILTLTLPKAESTLRRRIAVTGA